MKNEICVQCGSSRSEIKRDGLICGIVGPSTENGCGELKYEWERHRFRPYSKKELESKLADENAVIDQMGDMADWYNEIIECECGWKDKRSSLSFDEKKHTFNCPKCKKIND